MAACVDIARVHLEAGDAKATLSWLQRVPLEERFQEHDRDQLLLKIYDRIGDKDKQAEVAWRIFRRHRSAQTLSELLAVIGHDQRSAVITREIVDLLDETTLSNSNAMFLVEVAHLDAAETYLLERADQLNGDFYAGLLPLAEAMETAGRRLCASVIYRALLDSILQRAQSKAYTHGASYLLTLDSLAPTVSDWRGFMSHRTYVDTLRRQHKRKRSF